MRNATSRSRARRALAGLATAGAITAAAFSVHGCALVLNWGDFTGGDAAAERDVRSGETDGSPDGIAQRCVPAPPAGWSVPQELYRGLPSEALPPCGQGYLATPTLTGKSGLLDAPPAVCSLCTCSVPQGSSCNAPVLTFYSDATCTTSCGAAAELNAGTCARPPPCAAFEVSAATLASDGGCAPDGGTATRPSATWSEVARACEPAAAAIQASCNADEIIVPSPAPPFLPRVCVMQGGDLACPPGAYRDGPHVYYLANAGDNRACSPCTCGAATGGSCSYSAGPLPPGFRYADPLCAFAPNLPFAVPSGCQGLSIVQPTNPFMIKMDPALDAGSCAPAGGQPTGSVIPAMPTTFCCLR